MSQPAEMREGKPAMLKDKDFQWEDPLDLEGELSEEERMVRDTARGFAQDYLMPRVIAVYRDETCDPNMLPEMGKLGLLGPTVVQRLSREPQVSWYPIPTRMSLGARRAALCD